MKTLKYTILFILTLTIISCSNNNDDDLMLDETVGLNLIKTLSNDTHNIEIFSTKKNLEQGYNNIFLRIRDKESELFVENAALSWSPIMRMKTMSHSCPKSTIEKESLYGGYIVFQMAENDEEKWSLTINYTINEKDYSVKEEISVPAASKKNVTVFSDATNKKYVVALIDLNTPKVGLNDFKIGVYTMESMMSFPVVENYKIENDPRMPSMGNHSSPNNTDLVYNDTKGYYEGKLSLTMTGYWKLNLMLFDTNNNLIKGEKITEENESSSLFLEIEF